MLVQTRADNGLFRLLQSVVASLVFSTLVCGSTLGGPTHSADGAELYFVALQDMFVTARCFFVPCLTKEDAIAARLIGAGRASECRSFFSGTDYFITA
jgi:hypothetical protein